MPVFRGHVKRCQIIQVRDVQPSARVMEIQGERESRVSLQDSVGCQFECNGLDEEGKNMARFPAVSPFFKPP